MSIKERIFHSLLLEVLALLILVSTAAMFLEEGVAALTGLGISISIIAMVFNYFYNLGFDRIYGEDRISRSFKMRLGFGLGFEAGMIIITTPILMWALQKDFVTILIMDIGMVLFFLVYVISYNWCYDHIRERFVGALKPV